MLQKLWLGLTISVLLTCVMLLALLHCPMSTSEIPRCSSLNWFELVEQPLRAFSRQGSSGKAQSNDTLGFDTVYLIHLEARKDRQRRIKLLVHELGLRVNISYAVPAHHPTISQIYSHVAQQRQALQDCHNSSYCDQDGRDDLFTEDVYRLQNTPEKEQLGLAGADLWTQPATQAVTTETTTLSITPGISMHQILLDREKGLDQPAARYNKLPTSVDSLSTTENTQYLSLPIIACWHSHILTLRKFIDSGAASALILEDDIDMEVGRFARCSLL